MYKCIFFINILLISFIFSFICGTQITAVISNDSFITLFIGSYSCEHPNCVTFDLANYFIRLKTIKIWQTFSISKVVIIIKLFYAMYKIQLV